MATAAEVMAPKVAPYRSIILTKEAKAILRKADVPDGVSVDELANRFGLTVLNNYAFEVEHATVAKPFVIIPPYDSASEAKRKIADAIAGILIERFGDISSLSTREDSDGTRGDRRALQDIIRASILMPEKEMRRALKIFGENSTEICEFFGLPKEDIKFRVSLLGSDQGRDK